MLMELSNIFWISVRFRRDCESLDCTLSNCKLDLIIRLCNLETFDRAEDDDDDVSCPMGSNDKRANQSLFLSSMYSFLSSISQAGRA